GTLGTPETRAVDDHLKACAPCRERLEGLHVPELPTTVAIRANGKPHHGTAHPVPPRGEPAVPPVIAGYEILEEIGQGGVSVVYRARDPRLKRHVALKLLRPGGPGDECQPQRFRAEAEIIARLRHEGIVQVYEVGEEAGQLYLVLELVEGGDLHELTRHRPQPPPTAAAWVAALARTMAFAHA